MKIIQIGPVWLLNFINQSEEFINLVKLPSMKIFAVEMSQNG